MIKSRATKKQTEFLRSRGIRVRKYITKQEASKLIRKLCLK